MRRLSVALAVLLLFFTVSCVETRQAVRQDKGPAGTDRAEAVRVQPEQVAEAENAAREDVQTEASRVKESQQAAAATQSSASAEGTRSARSGSSGSAAASGSTGQSGGQEGRPSAGTSGGAVTTVPVYVEVPGTAAKPTADNEETDEDTFAGETAEPDADTSGDEGTTDEDTGSGTDTEYVDGLIADGDFYANEGDAPRAAGYYQQALNADPENQTAISRLNGLIEVVTQFGKPEDVGMVMQELIIYAPENVYYRYTYGRYMLSVGFVNEAYSALELAANIEPENPVYLTEFGNVKLYRGDYAGALVDFETSIALAPSYNLAYVKKAYVFIKTGSAAEAGDILHGVLEREPTGFVACYAYALLGDKPAMLEQLNQVMATEPYLKWFIQSALEFEAYRQDPDFVEALNRF